MVPNRATHYIYWYFDYLWSWIEVDTLVNTKDELAWKCTLGMDRSSWLDLRCLGLKLNKLGDWSITGNSVLKMLTL